VLHAWGQGKALRGTATLRISPRRAAVGDSVTLDVVLQAGGRSPQSLLVDYAVHHVKANGSTSPKVFKGWTLELAGGQTLALRKTHSLKPITTRRYYGGMHRIELLVNGRSAAEAVFELKA
jgi:hypothetical protein